MKVRIKCWTRYNDKVISGRTLPMLCRRLGSLGYTDGEIEVHGLNDDFFTRIRYDSKNCYWEYDNHGWKRLIHTDGKAVSPNIENEIVEVLQKKPNLTITELLESSGLGTSGIMVNSIRATLYKMRDEGKAVQKCTKGWYTWSLIE